jgi:hypothetical protein
MMLSKRFLLFLVRVVFGSLRPDHKPAQFALEGMRAVYFHHGAVIGLAPDGGKVLVGRKARTQYRGVLLGRGLKGEEKNAEGNRCE